MPLLSSKDRIKSGVPLGGIGAGKLEILPSGVFNAFTFLNNWGQPISGNAAYPGILGYHLGAFCEPVRTSESAGPKAVLLQTIPVAGIRGVRSIRYEGFFPQVRLTYEEPSLQAEISLDAFSAWVPGDHEASGSSVVYFKLTAKNKKSYPVRAAFLFMGRNLCGDWCVGRQNRVEDNSDRVDLLFSNPSAARLDPRRGEMLWSFEKKGWQVNFVESWNAVLKNFHWNPETISLRPWDDFSKTGSLQDSRSGAVAYGENHELCGAVSASTLLKPGEERSWNFSLVWSFPGLPEGHWRAPGGDSVKLISRRAQDRRTKLEKKTQKIRSLVFSLPFPEWFNDALLTNLAPFFSATRRLADGRFAFYEAPIICPLLGTIDVGFYGSIPLSFFFPQLEISQLLQFANAQRPDGYIPHDLGRNRLDCPSNGTTFFEWKDLNPKFVLMAWRDYLWSGDTSFLKKVYPRVKKAILWSLEQDFDRNGLPDHEGADQTFDLWEMKGTNPYTAGLFLASLLAARKMARFLRDGVFEARCDCAFLRGRDSFGRELWNGRFFGSGYCALSQLNGQWYADLLGLGSIADDRHIQTALGTILKENSRHSRFGMVNSVLPDGRADISNEHSRNVWAGMNYAFLSLSLMRGFALRNVLKEAHKLWNNVVYIQKDPWNQPDTVDSKTGRYVFGDSYYRNMAIWSIPIAHAKKSKKTAKILFRLKTIG